MNQHPGAEQKDDLNNLRTAIDLSQATLVVLDSAGTPLERVWWVMGGKVKVKVICPEARIEETLPRGWGYRVTMFSLVIVS